MAKAVRQPWDFTVECWELDTGHYRVRVTGNRTGRQYEDTGWSANWTLLRLMARVFDENRFPSQSQKMEGVE